MTSVVFCVNQSLPPADDYQSSARLQINNIGTRSAADGNLVVPLVLDAVRSTFCRRICDTEAELQEFNVQLSVPHDDVDAVIQLSGQLPTNLPEWWIKFQAQLVVELFCELLVEPLCTQP